MEPASEEHGVQLAQILPDDASIPSAKTPSIPSDDDVFIRSGPQSDHPYEPANKNSPNGSPRYLDRCGSHASSEHSVEYLEEKRKRTQAEVEKSLEYFRAVLKDPWWLIMPHNRWMQRWDLVIMICLSFTAIVTPFEVAILPSPSPSDLNVDWLFVTNRIIDVIFVIDMGLCFFTAYRSSSKDGCQYIKDWKKITNRYLTRWFIVDLVSILPYDFMGTKSLKVLRVFRIIRLLKLLRVVKASRIYQRYSSLISLPSSVISLVKHMFFLILFGHWMSCIWIMTADMQPHSTPTWIDSFGYNFYRHYGLNDPHEEGAIHGQWRLACEDDCHSDDIYDFDCADNCHVLTPFEIYSGAFYWSMVSITSVGYGDISPQNGPEMLLTTVYLLIASFFWAWIIGSMSALVATSDPGAIAHQQTMDALNIFMVDKGLPENLRRRLRTFMGNSKELSKNAQHQILIEKLSPALKAEVQGRSSEWIKNLKMFEGKELSRDFVVGVCSMMSGTVYEANEAVAWDDKLFCVSRGVASRKGKIRTAGTCWGEDFILSCDDLKDKFVANALTFVEIVVLRRSDFFMLLKDFNSEANMVRRAVVRLATKRGILAAASELRSKMVMSSTGSKKKPSLTDIFQMELLNQHHALIKPGDRVRLMVQHQGERIELLEKQIAGNSEKLDRLIHFFDDQTEQRPRRPSVETLQPIDPAASSSSSYHRAASFSTFYGL